MQVTDLLKDVHATGQTNSDLKSDNICLGEYKENLGIISQLKLIDFGLAQKFAEVDPATGQMVHIKDGEKTSFFVGSLAFGSPNAHKLARLSRRDDFFSLLYMLSYLMNAQMLFVDPRYSID